MSKDCFGGKVELCEDAAAPWSANRMIRLGREIQFLIESLCPRPKLCRDSQRARRIARGRTRTANNAFDSPEIGDDECGVSVVVVMHKFSDEQIAWEIIVREVERVQTVLDFQYV